MPTINFRRIKTSLIFILSSLVTSHSSGLYDTLRLAITFRRVSTSAILILPSKLASHFLPLGFSDVVPIVVGFVVVADSSFSKTVEFPPGNHFSPPSVQYT